MLSNLLYSKCKIKKGDLKMTFEELLKEFSGLLSRMKVRDGNEELNKICEKNFKKDLTK